MLSPEEAVRLLELSDRDLAMIASRYGYQPKISGMHRDYGETSVEALPLNSSAGRRYKPKVLSKYSSSRYGTPSNHIPQGRWVTPPLPFQDKLE